MITSTQSKELIDVLIIEDDEDDFFIATNLLSKASIISANVEWTQSYEDGLEMVTSRNYDVCLVDYRLGARNGLELLKEAVERGSTTPMILLTGQGDLEVDVRAMMAGAADYLVKGQIDAQVLERSIRYALERRRADERIREQAALLDKARDAISAYNLDRRVIYWNKSAERLTGWPAEEVLGERTGDLLYGEDSGEQAAAWEAVLRDGEWIGELRQRSRHGAEIFVESRWTLVRDGSGMPSSVLVINTDITERKKLETQFLRSQRMESIGRLVGGIAHDLGNLLVPILLGVKVLQQRFADDEKTSRTLGMIQKSAQRGSDMVKQVLAFARGVEGERVPLNLSHVIQEIDKITQETFPATVTIKTEISNDLWMVKGDATQLQQVLMNLCVNARDVMPDGGELLIRVDNLLIDERSAKHNIDARPGKFVRLTVSDTGPGVPPEVIDKVFEPFFTTKPVGKGTGLGLSTVYSIVRSHGGFVSVDSEAGRGTSFYAYLPASEENEAARRDESSDDNCVGNGELILVVDDEEFILDATREVLERLGYRVLTANDGTVAVRIFEERGKDIDLVVTDIMMPQMDGIATIRALKKLRPDLPIVAASGITGSKIRKAVEEGAEVWLAKPFTTEKLCATLQELLRKHQTSSDGSKDK